MRCPRCDKETQYPDGGYCRSCYKELKEEGYWLQKWHTWKERITA